MVLCCMDQGDTTLRAEGPLGGQSQHVDGLIDEENMSVLETCALGWVKEAVSMRVLAKEMAAAGLDGFEIMMSYRHGLVVLMNGLRQQSTHPDVLGSLSVVSWFTYGRKAHSVTLLGYGASIYGSMRPRRSRHHSSRHEASVASPRKNSPVEQVGDDSSHWHANQLWEIESAQKGHGALMVVGGASDRVVCDRGGVFSEGDVDFAFTGIRSREGLDIIHPSVSIAERDSLDVMVVGDCESAEKYGRVVGVNDEGAPSAAVLGLVGAAATPIIGSAHGGAGKVKSVNTLVEALGSPAQKRVIVVARSRRGCRRPAKELKWETVFS
ncbi:hypothetical protein V6N12_034555 [Hibiscus sabdariffa]|uniref:Uncharacterized protein n=1 Tax=Hibiscus sabdariffa TaxID=183260 RepID=A0ABR2DHI6_9ROSI